MSLFSPQRIFAAGIKPSGGLRLSSFSLVFIGLFILLFGAACAQGSYPVDFFYEMHYQPSYYGQEPPRLAPPAGAVPVTGKEVPLTVDTYSNVQNPIPGEGIEQGRLLYQINCAMCHGLTGKGDGTVLQTMMTKYNYTPKLSPDLTAIAAFDDSFLFAIISNRDLIITDPNVNKVMPQFQQLLTPEERWMLVNYIKAGLPQ